MRLALSPVSAVAAADESGANVPVGASNDEKSDADVCARLLRISCMTCAVAAAGAALLPTRGERLAWRCFDSASETESEELSSCTPRAASRLTPLPPAAPAKW